jgi:hypothetical protein
MRLPWTTPVTTALPSAGKSAGWAQRLRTGYDRAAEMADQSRGWDRFPRGIGLAIIFGLLSLLRQHNLADTEVLPHNEILPLSDPPPGVKVSRTADGSFNSLAEPRNGMSGTRFGRNVPLDHIPPVTDDTLLTPSPLTVSRGLLARRDGEFQSAESLNLLAAAWVQFMVIDWFSHGRQSSRGGTDGPRRDGQQVLPLPIDSNQQGLESKLVFTRMPADPTRLPEGEGPPTFVNSHSHWWDLSSIYGSSVEAQDAVRSFQNGKLRVNEVNTAGSPTPGSDPSTIPGFWVGQALMATLFVLEHNAICDGLLANNPAADDEQLFQQARLINAALVAKIHTVEWTPMMLGHPTTVLGMRVDWYGLAGRRLTRALRTGFGRDKVATSWIGDAVRGLLRNTALLTGLPGSKTRQFGVPFALTEEFTAVYRMHSLIPDTYDIREHRTNKTMEVRSFPELAGPAALDVLGRQTTTDLLYTFGTSHPGTLTLRNYPTALMEFKRRDGKIMDLAATDILRMREAAVPRYNAFRRALRLAPVATFAELSDDPSLVAAMQEIYGDVEKVDLLVGMLAERKPRGFAISDTAFRIFMVMAPRRLQSDRFLTDDYTPHVYTAFGLRWIENTTMSDILLRHFPALQPALNGLPNAFQPWNVPDRPSA